MILIRRNWNQIRRSILLNETLDGLIFEPICHTTTWLILKSLRSGQCGNYLNKLMVGVKKSLLGNEQWRAFDSQNIEKRLPLGNEAFEKTVIFHSILKYFRFKACFFLCIWKHTVILCNQGCSLLQIRWQFESKCSQIWLCMHM